MYIPFNSIDQVITDLQNASKSNNTPLWLLGIADCHGKELPKLLDGCREAGLSVCGGIFPGVIHGEELKKTGLIARPVPPDSYVITATLTKDGVAWNNSLPTISKDSAYSSILFVDCLVPHISSLMEDLYDQYGSQINHFGAGCGYHDLRTEPSIFTENGQLDNAALMIISRQRSTVRVRHGWNRQAGPFVASRTEGNIIKELNWEPAGSFYRQEVIKQNSVYTDRPIFPDMGSVYPLCIAKEGGEDVMRDPMGLTDRDEIVVLSDVAENSIMYLAHGDHKTLIAAAQQAVEDCGTPDDVEQCFISDCFSRVLMLGDHFKEELKAANMAVKHFSDVTPEGVIALGEVANNGGQYLEFFNKTFVIALTHH